MSSSGESWLAIADGSKGPITNGPRPGAGSISTKVIATAFGLAIMLSVYYAPVLIYMFDRERAVPLLARMTEWIMANLRMIEIAVGLGFGLYFLAKGLAVLL
ncbi:MAG: GAP family protein [Thermoleophilaceae bacterium]